MGQALPPLPLQARALPFVAFSLRSTPACRVAVGKATTMPRRETELVEERVSSLVV